MESDGQRRPSDSENATTFLQVDEVGFEQLPGRQGGRASSGGYEVVGVVEDAQEDQWSPRRRACTFVFDQWQRQDGKGMTRHSTANCRGDRINIPNDKLVFIPENIPQEVAVSIPYRGLNAYRAVEALRKIWKDEHVGGTGLVVGSHGLGLWTASTITALIPNAKAIRWVLADISVHSEEAIQAVQHNNWSPYDVVNWKPSCYESDIVDKTLAACPNGVNVIIDFSGSSRTARRVVKLLRENCAVVSVGELKNWSLPSGGQGVSIGFVSECDLQRLPELVHLLESGKISPPKLLPLEALSDNADEGRSSLSPDVFSAEDSSKKFFI